MTARAIPSYHAYITITKTLLITCASITGLGYSAYTFAYQASKSHLLARCYSQKVNRSEWLTKKVLEHFDLKWKGLEVLVLLLIEVEKGCIS